ncbi:MAG: nitroreductase family protein [Alphaproteobacteria bacterium]|nr:nitroreductase family protein [Alphaproteobacteria bacterium]
MTDQRDALTARYGVGDLELKTDLPPLVDMQTRGSCRVFKTESLPDALLNSLAATALASPTKSDLQQRDILFVEDPALRTWINSLFPDMPWIVNAPHFVIFLGNNRRLRQIHQARGHDFANDHLDAFFNSAVDAAIAMSAFITAAERMGLGTCPISALRNHAQAVSDRIGLPKYVFPICGMTLGQPVYPARISPRLGLSHTVHRDRFQDDTILDGIAEYDMRRNKTRPFTSQRNTDRFGKQEPYTWSEDKARQYAEPERADFGDFIRKIGFNLS